MAKRKGSILPSKGPQEHPQWLWSNTAFADRCPAMYEFLACGYQDDEPRKGGSVTIFVHQGQLKACFLDKSTQLAFYAVLSADGDVLSELEAVLAGGHDPWQPVRGDRGKPVF